MGTARQDILPFLATMTHHCHNRELTVDMATRYELDAEDVAFITGSGASTNKVTKIVEEATERREEKATAAAPLSPRSDGSISSESSPAVDAVEEPETEGDDQSGLADFL